MTDWRDMPPADGGPVHTVRLATPAIAWRALLPAGSARAVADPATKKAAIEAASTTLADAHPGLDPWQLLEALLDRERLGSTGLGEGVAIPHCRLEDCRAPAGALLRLNPPVDFDAPDGVAVDLLFALVVPDGERKRHLDILAALANTFAAAANRAALRQAGDAVKLRDTWLAITGPAP